MEFGNRYRQWQTVGERKPQVEYEDGAWRRSLWLPASGDVKRKYVDDWCFSMYESTDGNGDGEDATVVICEPLVPGCTTSQLTCIADKTSCWNFDSEYPSEQPEIKRRSRDWEARRQHADNHGDNHGENGNDDGGDSDGDDSNDDNNNNSSGNMSNDNQKGNGNNDQSSDDDRPSGDAGNSIPKTSGKPIRGKGQSKSFRFKQVR